MGWTEETFERLRDATPEALVSRMRVNHAMILNVINQPADPVATLRALMEDNHEDERGRARLAEQAAVAERGAARLRACSRRWPSPTSTAGRSGSRPRCRPTSRSTSRWRRSRRPRSTCSTPSPRPTRSTCSRVVESILDDPFPVLMAQANKERGEAVAEMKADGIEYEERMELLEEVTYPRPLAEPLEQALRLYRETHPWVLETDLSPEVGRARHVRVGPDVHRVHRLLRRRPLGGARPALPERRLPGAAPDGARARSGPRSSTTSSSGSARRSARSTRACSTSGRR